MEGDVFQRGQTVRGQLQHKGSGLALEDEFFKDDARQNGKHQTGNVEGEDHKTAVSGEKGGGEQAVDRQPCRARHKGHQHDGHAPVPLVLHGARPHNGGHRAAETHQHGDKGLAAEAKAPQQAVHDKGRPGHIARVLQEGEKQEQNGNLGQEGEYAPNPGNHAVHQQGLHPGRHSGGGQDRANKVREITADQSVHPIRQNLARPEGQGKHGQHHQEKDRYGQEPVGDNGVDPVRQSQGPVRLPPLHRKLDHILEEAVAAVGHQGLPVAQGIGPLVLPADGLQLLPLRVCQVQGLLHQGVPLQQLDRRPVGGQAGGVGPVVDQLPHPVVDGMGVIVVEVVGLHRHPHMHLVVGHLQQRPDILPRPGGDGDDGHPQSPGQPLQINLVPPLFYLVHKVEGDDHRPLQLQKLGRQIQVSLDVGGVDDIDDGVGVLPHDEVPGHNLLHGVGGQGIDARQVHHRHRLAVHLGPALFLFHRHAGPIAHILVGAGEGVEERGLAAVWIAHQGQLHLPGIVAGVIRRAAVLRLLMGVVGAHAAQSGLVRDVLDHSLIPAPAQARGLVRRTHCDLSRVLLAQRKLIAPEVHFDGVPEGGDLPHRHQGSGRQPHIHQPALHGSLFISHRKDDRALAGGHLHQGSGAVFHFRHRFHYLPFVSLF